MNIREIQGLLRVDIGEDVEVKTVVCQLLIWADHYELRAFCADGRVFSCLYEGEDKIGKFVLVPKEIQK